VHKTPLEHAIKALRNCRKIEYASGFHLPYPVGSLPSHGSGGFSCSVS
jgi:hypothetical protein